MKHFQNTWLPSQFLTENTFHRDDNFGHCNIINFTFATQSLVIWLQIFQISVISLLGCNWYSLFPTPFVHECNFFTWFLSLFWTKPKVQGSCILLVFVFCAPGFAAKEQLWPPEDFLAYLLPGFYSETASLRHLPFYRTQGLAGLSTGMQQAAVLASCHQIATAAAVHHSAESRQSMACKHCPSGASPVISAQRKRHYSYKVCMHWPSRN